MSDPGARPIHCPYKGLMPYDRQDADYFFGRDAESEVIAANLRGSRLTLLYGPSGVGKSSVLRAGVAPRIHRLATRRGGSPTPDTVLAFFRGWSDDPVAGLLAAVDSAVRAASGGRPSVPVDPKLALSDALDQWTLRIGTELRPRGTLLLVLDQFEEYFLYHPAEDAPGSFAAEFPRLVNRPELRVNVLVSMREDALARLDRFKGRIPSLFENFLRIDHLTRAAGRQAIVRPLERFRERPESAGMPVEVEPGLVESVLDQVAAGRVQLGRSGRGLTQEALAASGQAIETPYLQLVLTRLWDAEVQVGSRVLRLDTLSDLGGAESIVRRHLDEAMGRLDPADRDVAAGVLGFLVTPSGAKIAQDSASLARWADQEEPAVAALLHRLTEQDFRILRTVPVSGGADRYEIYHDVLGRAIVDYTETFQAERERARQHAEEERRKAAEFEAEQEALTRRLQKQRLRVLAVGFGVSLLLALAAVTQWVQARKSATFAIRALQVARAERKNAIAEAERATKEEERAREALKKYETQRTIAGQEREIADSRRIAAAATSLLDQRLDLAMLLAAEAYRIQDTFEARSILFRTAMASPHLRQYLPGHTDAVLALRFSPDGQSLHSFGRDRKAVSWDLSARPPARTEAVGFLTQAELDKSFMIPSLVGAALRADNRAVAQAVASTATRGMGGVEWAGQVSRWNPANGEPLGPDSVIYEGDATIDVSDSPDGRFLALWGARIWADSITPTLMLHRDGDAGPPIELDGLDGEGLVTAVAFSANGSTLAAAVTRMESPLVAESVIHLWSVADGRHLGPLEPIAARVAPRRVRRVSALVEDRPGALIDSSGIIQSLAFHPDGSTLAAGTVGNQVQLWDSSDRRLLAEVPARQAYARPSGIGGSKAAPSPRQEGQIGPDARWLSALATAPATSGVTCLEFDAVGRVLAAGLADRTVSLIDPEARATISEGWAGHAAAVTCLAFAPDGRTLVTGDLAGGVIWWDIEPADVFLVPEGDNVWGTSPSVAFSSDSRTLAVGYASGVVGGGVVLIDPESGRRVGEPKVFTQGRVTSISFSPTQSILAVGYIHQVPGAGDYLRNSNMVGEIGSRVALINTTSGRRAGDLEVSIDGFIASIHFSPNGSKLAVGTSAGDSLARGQLVLLDIVASEVNGKPLTLFSGNVSSLAFSRDNQLLAVGVDSSRSTGTGIGDEATAGVVLLNPVSGRPMENRRLLEREVITSLAFAGDGSLLAAGVQGSGTGIGGSNNASIALLDPVSIQPIGERIVILGSRVLCLSFSPDATMLVVGHTAGLSFFEVSSGLELGIVPGFAGVRVKNVAYSPDGARLAVGSSNIDRISMIELHFPGFSVLSPHAMQFYATGCRPPRHAR